MERSLGGCEGGLAAGGAGRAPRPCLGPGDGLGCGKHPWGSGPFGRWPAQSQRRLATPPRSGGESRCPTGGAGEGGALEHPPPPAAVGPGRLSSPGRLRLPRAPLGPARTRVLGSAPALALRALGAGMPGGVACLPRRCPGNSAAGRGRCGGWSAGQVWLEEQPGPARGRGRRGGRREGAFPTSSPQRCHGDCRGSLPWPAAALEAAATDPSLPVPERPLARTRTQHLPRLLPRKRDRRGPTSTSKIRRGSSTRPFFLWLSTQNCLDLSVCCN